MTAKSEPLIVADVFTITNAGTGVFFDNDTPALYPGPVFVTVSTPRGRKFEAAARVEAPRKNLPGEVMAMIFRELELSDIPAGSIIQILRRQPAD